MKTKQSRLFGIAKVGIGLAAILFSASAAADSVVSYSGYACLGASVTGNHGGFTEGAGFYGNYTRCPLIRINSDNTANIGTILVRVRDNSSTQSITCYAVSCAGLGDSCSQTSSYSTGTSYTGATYLNMGSLAAYSTGYAYIHCSFPSDGSQSILYSYRATD